MTARLTSRRHCSKLHRPLKAVASALLFTLIYTPLPGSLNSTLALAQTSYAYDKMDNLTQITDGLGNVTTQSYDSLGRLIQQRLPITNGVTPTIHLRYDPLDQLIGVVDSRSLTTGYTVDGLGNQTAMVSPDTGNSAHTYNDAGKLESTTDARGKTTTYRYDRIKRLTRISTASGTATQFDYDGVSTGTRNAIGYLSRMVDASGQTTYDYDGFGNVLRKQQTVGSGTTARRLTIAYAYTRNGVNLGQIADITYPSGNRVSYQYDAAARVSGLTLHPANDTGGTETGTSIALLTAIDYFPFGPVKTWTWGNSNNASNNTYKRTMDLDGRITGYPLGNADTNGLQRQVTYDDASRIIGISHTGKANNTPAPVSFDHRYGYDNLGRLTGVTVVGGDTQRYQYDQNGNRTQAIFGSKSYATTINASSNRLTSSSGPTPAKHVYDANGNLLSDGSRSYTYNDRGRMATSTNAGNTVIYTYNGLGQRILKQGPTVVVAQGVNYYAYDEAGHLLGEYNAQMMQETVYLGDMPVAVLKPNTVGNGSNTNIYYIYADHINTPRVITESSDNQIVWRWDNADPFGILPPLENPSGLGPFTYNPRFPGQLYDRETGHFYNYYRDYDPQSGRYLQSDPIGLAGGMNTYGYVDGNPLSYADPYGLNPATAIGAGIGTIILPGPGTVVGAVVGTAAGIGIGIAIANNKADDAVAYPDNPKENPEKFTPIPGTGGKFCPEDGSVWERDNSKHGGEQWKRWPDKRSWGKGRPPISVWPDGRVRK